MAINDPGTPESVDATDNAPDMKMDESDFQALRDAADSVGVQDVQLGRALNLFVLHLGHLYGFDPAQEDEKARKAAQEEEDKETAEQEQAEEEKNAKEQALLSATPAYSTSPDGSIPPTDVPVDPSTTQEGV